MKKFLVVASCCVGLFVLGSYSSYAETALPAGHPQLQKFDKVSTIVMDKCMSCHSRDFDLPFYASIPGIKQIIEADFKDGLRAMDLNIELLESAKNQPVSETVLAKMEWVTLNETMPPAKFTAVHWGSRVNSDDRKAILDWVQTSRSAHYSTKLAIPKYANEPVQPMVDSIKYDEKKAALGEKLFNDKRLSGDNTLSCASCHQFDKAGTDNLRFSEGVRKQVGDINAPTVFNAAFNVKQFWNGRSADLQEQAGGPPLNPIEMDSKDFNQIIVKLSEDATLTAEAKAIYTDGWTEKNITDAISEYEKTLITPNSRFDLFLKGDEKAISAEEFSGYERYKAYRCASCHVGQSLGGQSFEYMDLKKDYFADRGNPLGSDEGLKAFTKNENDLRRFKVPNLRNIELTAPYLHDGTVKDLDESVRIMGVYLSGMDIPQKDRDLIVAFLRTLTGQYEGKLLTGTAVVK